MGEQKKPMSFSLGGTKTAPAPKKPVELKNTSSWMNLGQAKPAAGTAGAAGNALWDEAKNKAQEAKERNQQLQAVETQQRDEEQRAADLQRQREEERAARERETEANAEAHEAEAREEAERLRKNARELERAKRENANDDKADAGRFAVEAGADDDDDDFGLNDMGYSM